MVKTFIIQRLIKTLNLDCLEREWRALIKLFKLIKGFNKGDISEVFKSEQA